MTHGYAEQVNVYTYQNGREQSGTVNFNYYALFKSLRSAMRETAPEKGPWDIATITIERTGQFNFDFNYDGKDQFQFPPDPPTRAGKSSSPPSPAAAPPPPPAPRPRFNPRAAREQMNHPSYARFKELEKQIASAFVQEFPSEAASGILTVRILGRLAEQEKCFLDADEREVAGGEGFDFRPWFHEIRAAMYEYGHGHGRGAWGVATVTVERTGKSYISCDYRRENHFAQPPSPEDIAEDLRRFPPETGK
jgi:hypothetical protein